MLWLTWFVGVSSVTLHAHFSGTVLGAASISPLNGSKLSPDHQQQHAKASSDPLNVCGQASHPSPADSFSRTACTRPIECCSCNLKTRYCAILRFAVRLCTILLLLLPLQLLSGLSSIPYLSSIAVEEGQHVSKTRRPFRPLQGQVGDA